MTKEQFMALEGWVHIVASVASSPPGFSDPTVLARFRAALATYRAIKSERGWS